MLFNKKMEPCCSYCKAGRKLNDEEVVCEHKGIVDAWGSCRKFEYDPLKRIPGKADLLEDDQFSEEDFEL